jgi:hypothetical protein
MTQLELFEDRTSRRGMSRFGAVRSLRYLIATLSASWQARAALARIVRDGKPGRYDEVPAYLRRDLGLPDVDPAPWRSTMIILLYLRLK